MKTEPSFNPFPGLRPFESDEDHLFFGREKQIDELLRRLRGSRFLAVVGNSGSGKSSLIKCGLVPTLYSGFMAKAGSAWRVSVLRPADDPIGQLAAALSTPESLGRSGELATMSRVLVESTLRRGTLGLVEAVTEAKVPPGENILIVVDQFEELFRFQRSREVAHPADEAVSFVKLLLEAAAQEEVPIYVVLTMRSDFLEDCMQYPGLPEAISTGQYLVPRMTRDELRAAITKPVAVAGGEIASRLVVRLLNDVNDDPDQLPVLQHALMRTWNYSQSHRKPGSTIVVMDISDYEAIGTMGQALSLHAEEAYGEAESQGRGAIAERIFKALTDTYTDPRGVRRPTSTCELAAICDVPETEIVAVVEIFRKPGRSFLMPPVPLSIESHSIIDISHESVMRCWQRLAAWAEDERISAARYVRLARAAAWNEEGTAGLWRDPELEMGLQWRQKSHANAAWAERYDPAFDRAMAFLDNSKKERDRLNDERQRLIAEREQEAKRKLRQAQWGVAILVFLLAIVGVLGYVANSAAKRAEANLNATQLALGTMISLAGSDSAIAADVPQMEELRKELAKKASEYYTQFFGKQFAGTEQYRKQMAFAHLRLGDINRILEDIPEAVKMYKIAIGLLQELSEEYPDNADYPQALATAYNWMGESQRSTRTDHAAATEAYDHAIALQEELVQKNPQKLEYQQELARTHYNRGIVRFDDRHLPDAEIDYRAAAAMLEILPEDPASFRQDLARVNNELARLLKAQQKPADARRHYEKAIEIHEALSAQHPEIRDYKIELAEFHENLGILLQGQNDIKGATLHNQMAIDLYDQLASPVPTFSMKLADAYTLRGRILESQGDRAGAEKEYVRAVAEFAQLEKSLASARDKRPRPELHLRYGDALLYSAGFWYSHDRPRTIGLLRQAIAHHMEAGTIGAEHLCYDYNMLAEAYLASGSTADAHDSLGKFNAAIGELPESSQLMFRGMAEKLQNKLSTRK